MHYRVLGKTGLRVSLLSFGTGGPSNLGQSKDLAQKEQDTLVRRCLDLGINLFDTAPEYRRSEEILGRALKGVARDSYLLATKFKPSTDWAHDRDGVLMGDPNALVTSVENSLRELGTDYIDIMQFHGLPVGDYHQVVDRYYAELERLREQGKIRFIGFSEWGTFDPRHEVTVLALTNHPELWDTIMLRYGILNQYAAKEALPLALEHGVGIFDMASVRLRLSRSDQLEALIAEWKHRGVIAADSLPVSDPLGWLVHDEVDSVMSAGYKFAAEHPVVSSVLTGTSNIEHLDKNAAALEKPFLPESDWQRLVELFGNVAEPT